MSKCLSFFRNNVKQSASCIWTCVITMYQYHELTHIRYSLLLRRQTLNLRAYVDVCVYPVINTRNLARIHRHAQTSLSRISYHLRILMRVHICFRTRSRRHTSCSVRTFTIIRTCVKVCTCAVFLACATYALAYSHTFFINNIKNILLSYLFIFYFIPVSVQFKFQCCFSNVKNVQLSS